MAHYAKIEDGLVTQVIVADSLEWCESNLGGRWLQTSYNTFGGVNNRVGGQALRKNFAGIGFTYDAARDAFIAPEPDNAIGFDEETCLWIVPIEERYETAPE